MIGFSCSRAVGRWWRELCYYKAWAVVSALLASAGGRSVGTVQHKIVSRGRLCQQLRDSFEAEGRVLRMLASRSSARLGKQRQSRHGGSGALPTGVCRRTGECIVFCSGLGMHRRGRQEQAVATEGRAGAQGGQVRARREWQRERSTPVDRGHGNVGRDGRENSAPTRHGPP